MKKLVLAILLLAGLTTNAQTGHLTFKGVPIDGTINEFVGKLKQKGLRHMGTENGSAILIGDFASYKECTIAVASYDNGIVSKVVVAFPDKDTWSKLYNNYATLKEMLTEKYGEPALVEERFDGYGAPDDDEDRMYRVKFDRCKYLCDFAADGGIIELRIEHTGVSSCYIILIYQDTANTEKARSSAIDDL